MTYFPLKYMMLFAVPLLVVVGGACTGNRELHEVAYTDTIESNIAGKGIEIIIDFQKGQYHNHPTMAFWIEDVDGNFIQLLYITQSLSTGVFNHGELAAGKWDTKSGEARRPATLPYFLHKRGIRAEDGLYLPTPKNPIPDAYTGATPPADFVLKTRTDEVTAHKFRLLLEINQSWDWNEYWTNNKYPDNLDYISSCQPSVVYAVKIDLNETEQSYYLNPIGHGHYAGIDGKLYTDLTTLTTALQIIHRVKVNINK